MTSLKKNTASYNIGHLEGIFLKIDDLNRYVCEISIKKKLLSYISAIALCELWLKRKNFLFDTIT